MARFKHMYLPCLMRRPKPAERFEKHPTPNTELAAEVKAMWLDEQATVSLRPCSSKAFNAGQNLFLTTETMASSLHSKMV